MPQINIAIPTSFISFPFDFSLPEFLKISPIISSIKPPIINHKIIDFGNIPQPIINSSITAINPTAPNAVNKSPIFSI